MRDGAPDNGTAQLVPHHVLILLSEKVTAEVSGHVHGTLRSHGFDVEVNEADQIIVTPARDVIELEAEHANLYKPLVQKRVLSPFDTATRAAFDGVDDESFFSPAELSFLTHRILANLQVDAALEVAVKAAPGHRRADTHVGEPLLPCLTRLGIIESVVHLHDARELRAASPTASAPLPNVSALRCYYGEGVALYFEWLRFMAAWLRAPAVLGTATYVANKLMGMTVEDSPLVPLYSVFVVVWAVLFVKFWRRRTWSLALEWGTLWTPDVTEPRPGFHGARRVSSSTGQIERYFPQSRRLARYVLSVAVTAAMLAAAFCVMICSLNFQGYIQDASDVFYVRRIASLAAPGAPFDPRQRNPVAPLVPVVAHVAVILTLNSVLYRRVAAWLTRLENHATIDAHRASLIVKRVLFEAFDCYVALAYLAFWQLDLPAARRELVALFTADCARRVATEVALPWLLQRATAATRRADLKRRKDAAGERPSRLQAAEDMLREPYESFDDFIEMAVQFGYVTLFAGAMPLAATVACLYTTVESVSDGVKLTRLCQRPAAARSRDIGAWSSVILVQAWLSILTNCLVFAFSSDQLFTFVPQLFRTLKLPTSDVDDVGFFLDQGRWLMGIVMLVEHSLFFLCLLLWICIADKPAAVVAAEKRRRQADARQLANTQREQRLKLVAHKSD